MVETVEWNQTLTGQWIVQRKCASFLFPSRRLMTAGASDVGLVGLEERFVSAYSGCLGAWWTRSRAKRLRLLHHQDPPWD